jgi:hypothetical protein
MSLHEAASAPSPYAIASGMKAPNGVGQKLQGSLLLLLLLLLLLPHVLPL